MSTRPVVLAQAGTQRLGSASTTLDPRLRGDDGSSAAVSPPDLSTLEPSLRGDDGVAGEGQR